ncbi:LysM peptidoglycan-binding domain-containing protein [Rhodocyclaceae bacterium SMB388]
MIRIIFPLLFAVATLIGAPALAQPVALADNAPDSYTVVRGDTLWGISGRFLQQPWRWPEVWRLNREQIRNPHLIYPGQVIFLDRSGPYLSIGRRVGGDQRLSPRVYSEPVDAAINSIPLQDIEPFLIRPLIVDEAELVGAATIVATESERVFMGNGDTVFAKDVTPATGTWQVFRQTRPLIDPVTNEILAYEADYLGTARVVAPGTAPPQDVAPAHVVWRHPSTLEAHEEPWSSPDDRTGRSRFGGVPATLEILSAVEEIGTGDRMLLSDRSPVFAHVPRAPEMQIDGRLIGIYRGVIAAGRHSVVTLNVGARDGLEQGHVLALYRNRGSVDYTEGRVTETFDLPENRYGLAFVFRVFNRVAYALVMDSDGQVTIGDSVRTP